MTSDIFALPAEAQKAGADYSDIYLQSGVCHSAHYEDGKTDEISSSAAEGTGVRIIRGGRTYYAHTPGISVSAVSSAYADVMNSALSVKTCALTDDGESVMEPCGALAPADTDFMRKIDSEIRSQSGYVRQVSMRYSLSQKNTSVIRPDCSSVNDSRSYCTFSVQVVAEKDGLLQTGSERRYMSTAPSDFWNGTTPAAVAQTAFRRAMLMLDAVPCPAGRMSVLLAGEAGGTIVHEACGHGLEADIIEKDHSVYRGMLGKKVAGDDITMVDDATLGGLFGAFKFDDEGTMSERTVLIENGVLKHYMTDILSSRLYGYPMTGNGRRESYRCVPMPRMSNTFLTPGNESLESMLERAGNGLFVKKMGGGEVNPTTGDFVFYVAEANLIRNGKICEPVRGATLTGNGPEVLKNITALGNNLIMDPGTCGKSGQDVPVTDGQPSMLIKEITIGGSEA